VPLTPTSSEDPNIPTLRQRYIAAGLITPDPYLEAGPLTADEMDARGFHAAAHAKRRRS
jgi:hypothetical protein